MMEYMPGLYNNQKILNEDEDENIIEDVILLNNLQDAAPINENFNYQNQNNIPINTSEQNTLNLSNNNHISINSTLNTNAEFGDCSQNINNVASFLSFGQPQQKTKKELTPNSIETLQNFIIKEKNNIKNKTTLELKDIKSIKNNINDIDVNLDLYFKRPDINKNYYKISKIKSALKDDEKISVNEKISYEKIGKKSKINYINDLNPSINEIDDVKIPNEEK